MIIYRNNQPPLLSDYGIEVPMLKGRAEKVREEILKNFRPEVFSQLENPALHFSDFSKVHSDHFLQRCQSEPEKVIQETFELINADGSFNRYDPLKATKNLKDLIGLFEESCRASYLCVLEAMKNGYAYYLGGGYHHALSSKGRGFCLFNDIVISARKFQREENPGCIWVIDLDAHKGCGTAQITEKDDSIYTLSIHMKEGWPLDCDRLDQKGNLRPWFIPSSVDIEIGKNEEASYLYKLEEGLQRLSKLSPEPVMCIVVDGSDPYTEDALPSANLLKLSKDQCLQRNMLVYRFLRERKIPQAYLMSGGYGDKNWIIHYQFIAKALKEEWRKSPTP